MDHLECQGFELQDARLEKGMDSFHDALRSGEELTALFAQLGIIVLGVFGNVLEHLGLELGGENVGSMLTCSHDVGGSFILYVKGLWRLQHRMDWRQKDQTFKCLLAPWTQQLRWTKVRQRNKVGRG